MNPVTNPGLTRRILGISMMLAGMMILAGLSTFGGEVGLPPRGDHSSIIVEFFGTKFVPVLSLLAGGMSLTWGVLAKRRKYQ